MSRQEDEFREFSGEPPLGWAQKVSKLREKIEKLNLNDSAAVRHIREDILQGMEAVDRAVQEVELTEKQGEGYTADLEKLYARLSKKKKKQNGQ